MIRAYAGKALAAGQTLPYQIDGWPTINKFLLQNESPYTLLVNDGSNTFRVPAYYRDRLDVTNAFDGQVSIQPTADLAVASAAPASIVYITGYGPHDEIPPGLTGPLARLVTVGNILIQAQQIVQTGQPQPTAALEATPSASFTGATQQAIYNNDGSTYAGAGPGAIHPERHWSSDNAGNLSAVAFKTQPNNQESGMVGVGASNAVAAQLVLATCNAKTVWPSVPSSISLVDIAVTNAGAPSITDISTLGFSLLWSPSGAGGSFRRETYTTVGL